VGEQSINKGSGCGRGRRRRRMEEAGMHDVMNWLFVACANSERVVIFDWTLGSFTNGSC
jgi:hypothetical protein